MATIPESLAAAIQHHQAGRLEEAESLYRQILEEDSRQADAHHLLGVIAHQAGRHEDAAVRIRRALALDPLAIAFHSNLGLVYQALGLSDEAVASYRRALEIDPAFAAAHNNLGNVLKEQGKLEEAAASFRQAIAINSQYAEAHNNWGIVWKHQGRLEEAAACFSRALEIQPHYADALANLASLYERFNRPEEATSVLAQGLPLHPDHPHVNLVAARIEQRQGRVREAIERLERVRPQAQSNGELARDITFLLAQLHDQAGHTRQAWDTAVEANGLAMQGTRGWYADRNRYLRQLDGLQRAFTESWVASWTHASPPAEGPAPVFLVGFPRSGTTLLDVILDSHPQLLTLEEKPAVQRMQDRVAERPGGYPQALARLSADDIQALRKTYFGIVDQWLDRRPGCTLVDKFPLNIVSAGLVLRVFPSARFVLVVRHPYDVCLSCFLQNFKINPATANFFTLQDAAWFYTRVMDLHQQYLDVLPHAYHVVRYEDLVTDFRNQVRRVIEFLEVPWDDAILDYAARARERGMINTPSYGQVTRPLYRQSCDRWRRYAGYLGPARTLLAPYVRRFGYGGSPGQPVSPCPRTDDVHHG